jgi:uncharacterized membrane protein YadS
MKKEFNVVDKIAIPIFITYFIFVMAYAGFASIHLIIKSWF